MGRATARARGVVVHVSDAGVRRRATVDHLAGEEPLDIRLGGKTWAVTMRTPGHDVELVHGLLLAEGVITDPQELLSAQFCAPDAGPVGLPGAAVPDFRPNSYNTLAVTLAPQAAARAAIRQRSMVTASACGTCGAEAAEAYLSPSQHPPILHQPVVTPEVLVALPEQLRTHQKGFDRSGGFHAAMLATPDGTAVVVREDIGRHNAVDKVLGWALSQGRVPARDLVLVVSSRLSYEIVAKASMAGVGLVVAVSAASTMAVAVAQSRGVTVAAFTRKGRTTLYSHPERVLA